MRKGLAVFVVAAALVWHGAPLAGAAPNNNNAQKLLEAVTPTGVMAHEQAFQQIADANGGTRASGTPGYEASSTTSWASSPPPATPRRSRRSTSPSSRSSSRPPAGRARSRRLRRRRPSPSPVGGRHRPRHPGRRADPARAHAELHQRLRGGRLRRLPRRQHRPHPARHLHLRDQGGQRRRRPAPSRWSSSTRASRAAPDVVHGTLGAPGRHHPGGRDQLRHRRRARTRLTADGPCCTWSPSPSPRPGRPGTSSPRRRRAATDNVVVVGAHLDSVVRRARASTTTAAARRRSSRSPLQIAEGQAPQHGPLHVVRRGGVGLLGSDALRQPAQPGRASTTSPSTSTSTWSARRTSSASSTTATTRPSPSGRAAAGPPGSGYIEQRLRRLLRRRQGLASEPTPFSGRSDYGPFIAVGIPAGGLFTGAEGIKTAEQAAVYGGTAGEPYDPCYHQACDTIANVNTTAIDQMADAAAYAIITFAQNTKGSTASGARATSSRRSWIHREFGPLAAAWPWTA